MIEVEKKFLYDERTAQTLTADAEFVSEKTFTDTYFDDSNFSLTTKDMWLRNRTGKFELKISRCENIEKRKLDWYEEFETEKEIAEYFNWNISEKPLKDLMTERGLKPFAAYTTTRKKYKKDGFAIDVDTTDFGFNVIEIEIGVERESDMESATEKILSFAKGHGLQTGRARGKLTEFIYRNNPEHFQKLKEAKVVK